MRPGGADISNYLKNPVVLRNHTYQTQDIIGGAQTIEISDDGIHARTKFRDTELGRDAFSLASEGLGGWSIGFHPVEFDSVKDDKGKFKGFDFKSWELLEYSIVAIPMNQEAVNNAVQRGLVQSPNVDKFFTVEKQADEPVITAPDGATAERLVQIRESLYAGVLRSERRMSRADAGFGYAHRKRNHG